MGNLFQRPPSVIQYYGTQIQSAVQALPIPVVYGAPRMAGNIIYTNGFNSVKQQTGGKGGKGLLTGGKGNNQYLYYSTLIVALCEGPISNIAVIFQDSNTWFNLSGIREVDPNTQTGKNGQPNYVPTDAQFFPGGPEQLPWDYIASQWPNDARGYQDTCYIGLPNMQLDATALPPQLNWVPYGMFAGTCPLFPATFRGEYTDNNGQYQTSFTAGYVDADPALVIYDFLTNPRYGAGFPAALIDPGMFSGPNAPVPNVGDSALQTYCQAIGFGYSVAINNAEAASAILDRWTKNMAVAIVWTGAALKFIPYWDQYWGANPGWGADNPNGIPLKYFNPNISSVFALSDNQFIQAHNPDEEPVTLDRTDPIDIYNYVRVSFSDRDNQFNDNVAQDSDEVAIELNGPRVESAQVAHEFSYALYAQVSATVQLRRSLSVRRRVTFKLPPCFGFFDPMDIVTVTSGILKDFVVRIVSLEEDETGNITVLAEEFPAGAASPAVFAASPTTPPSIFQTNVPVGSINTPFIWEPTPQLIAAQGLSTQSLIVGASGSNGTLDPNWGGCYIYASLDNMAYQLLGTLNGPSRQGFLTSGLAAFGGTNPDTINTLSIDLTESGGELASTTDFIASSGVTLCAIMDPSGAVELLAYTTATLTGLYQYNLTGLYRGLYGTTASAHSSNAQFLRVDQVAFERPLPPQFLAQSIYFKFPSFNIYNQAPQELDDPSVIVYTYVPNGGGTVVFLGGQGLAGASGTGVLT